MSTLTDAGTKDNGKATKDTVRGILSGLQEVLTMASLRTTVEMVKAKCSMLMELNTTAPGETTPVTAKEYLNGLKALDDSRETSETTRCMETVL
jgi:hypothetical protein